MDVGALVGDRYRVTGRLARGGMAEVLAARDERLDREVALKVLFGAGGTDRARFDAEIRLLASFQHPHLVRVFDAGVHDGDPFLVLELAEGPTLAHLLAAGPLPDEQARTLGRDLADALAHVHAAGVVHRDVKPSNVLTGGDGRWLLADFGIARLVDATDLTATGAAIGTPAYLAPEQLTGEPATPALDVYALGLTVLEATTGQRAFPGPGAEAAMSRLAQDPDVAGAPVAWQALLTAMTARDPAARPTAAQVARRLADHEAGAPTEPLAAATAPMATATAVLPLAATAPAPARDRAPRRSHPWVGVAAALFVLALVVAALAWLGPDGGEDEVVAATTSSTAAPAGTTARPVATTTVPAAATVPPTVATTVPPTTADPCAPLEAQLDQLRTQQDALRDQPRDRGHDHDRGARDAKHQLDEQRREVERRLREAHC